MAEIVNDCGHGFEQGVDLCPACVAENVRRRVGWQKGTGKVHVLAPGPVGSRRARCGQSLYAARTIDVDSTPPDKRCRTCFPGSTRGAATSTSLEG